MRTTSEAVYPISTVERVPIEGAVTDYGFELISKRPTSSELAEWGISMPRGNDYTPDEVYSHALSCVKESWEFYDAYWPVRIAKVWMALAMYESGDRARDYFPRQFFTDIDVEFNGVKKHYDIVPLFARKIVNGYSRPNYMAAGCLAYGMGNVSGYSSVMGGKAMARRAAWDWKYNVELSVKILSRKWYTAKAHGRGMPLNAAVIYYHGWDGASDETTAQYLGRREFDASGREKRSSKRYYDNVMKLYGEYFMEADIRQCIFTQNKCGMEPQPMTPVGIMVHDTGCGNPNLKRYLAPDDGIIGENRYHNHWNQYLAENNKCVHTFIGRGVDKKVYTYQTLDWTLNAHHSGRHQVTHKRAWDMGYIGFEMCDDGYADEGYFLDVYEHAVALCVYLCQRFGLQSSDIISHREGHEMGIASNHGDPHVWFRKFGKSMDIFRGEVAQRLGESAGFRALSINDGSTRPEETEKVQLGLIARGYLDGTTDDDGGYAEADGWFGRKTKDAVTAFQKVLVGSGYPAMRSDGVVDETLYKMLAVEEPAEVPPEAEPEKPGEEEPPQAVDGEWLKEKLSAVRDILDEIEAAVCSGDG